MIKVKQKSEQYADSCSACYENKGVLEVEMGLEEGNTGRFRGGAGSVRLCESCAKRMSKLLKSRQKRRRKCGKVSGADAKNL